MPFQKNGFLSWQGGVGESYAEQDYAYAHTEQEGDGDAEGCYGRCRACEHQDEPDYTQSLVAGSVGLRIAW